MALNRLLQGCVAGLAAAHVAAHGLPSSCYPSLQAQAAHAQASAGRRAAWPRAAEVAAFNLSVPIDHFHNDSAYEPHSHGSFPLRYWFDASHYQRGGPVIVLAAGETSGEDRIPFLEHGIVSILAEATRGIGVILEHRYYGASFPVPDLSPEKMRFLSTEQALADTAYFAEHVQFHGLEHVNLTASAAPYIIYGGSYAGAFAAFARKLYPDVFWGAISSSGVTQAILDYWEYYEAARLFAPGDCASVTQTLTHIVDNILLGDDRVAVRKLKDTFGLGELDDVEFASTITRGIGGLQGTSWDPDLDSAQFAYYCGTVTSDALLFSSTRHLAPKVADFLALGGYGQGAKSLTNHMLNYIGYVRAYVTRDMQTHCKGKSVNDCYTRRGIYDRIDLDQDMWRSWGYQTCTQWGYFATGSGVPKTQLPLISRLIDLEYTTIHCREAFNITELPSMESVNKLGGFNFSYPRLGFIDGAVDPWRAATPHRIGLEERESTTSEPFILIEHGVHHWDENGLPAGKDGENFPPPAVTGAQKQEVAFVKAWLEDWVKMQEQVLDVPGEL